MTVYFKRLFFSDHWASHLGASDLEISGSRRSSAPLSVHSESDAESLLDHKRGTTDEIATIRGVNPRIISDATIGLSDGLTVPFALTAGLSALGSTKVVIFGGLAELIAGAISMGMGGYLGAHSEADSYASTLRSTDGLIHSYPTAADALVRNALAPYDLPDDILTPLAGHLSSHEPYQVDFLMRFHHALQPPSCNRAYVSALTIALGYFVGGFVPLVPYFFASDIHTAFWWSVGVMAIALFAFGYLKRSLVEVGEGDGGRSDGSVIKSVKSGVEMMVLGGVAAGAAMGLVRALGP